MNLGKLVLGEEGPLPCTPVGAIELLRRHGVPIAGAEVVVVGRGLTVGRPLGLLLTRRSENATVTLCHTGTRDLAAHVRTADIVVAAAGVPGIISADMVKPGAAVLDVGVSRRRRQDRRRRGRRRLGGRRLGLAEPQGRRADDARDAPVQHRGHRREGTGLTLEPVETPFEPPDDVPAVSAERLVDGHVEDGADEGVDDEPRRYPSTIGGRSTSSCWGPAWSGSGWSCGATGAPASGGSAPR